MIVLGTRSHHALFLNDNDKKSMQNARRRHLMRNSIEGGGNTSKLAFRPKLDAVGKTHKCRFLSDHYEIVRKIGEGTYGQVDFFCHLI